MLVSAALTGASGARQSSPAGAHVLQGPTAQSLSFVQVVVPPVPELVDALLEVVLVETVLAGTVLVETVLVEVVLVDVPPAEVVLVEAVRRYGPKFEAILEVSRVWVNGEPADSAAPISHDDEISVLPPVSGG